MSFELVCEDGSVPVLADPRNPALLYLVSLSVGSRPTQAGAIRDVARYLGTDEPITFAWHALTYAETTGVRAWAVERYAVATAQRYLAAMRGVMRQCVRLGTMTDEAYRRAVDFDPVRGANELAGRSLSSTELAALFAACNPSTPLGVRNAALLAVLYGGGLRRAELVHLDLGDLENVRKLNVRHGKGAKARTVYLPSSAAPIVQAWLTLRGPAPGPLFYPTTGGRPDRRHRLRSDRMCLHTVRLALRGLARRANVALFAPHDVRRTYAGDLLDAGADIVSVQKLMGHEQTTTTARYDRRPARARERAADLLSIPFVAG